jgi:RimJ/RimL family protein N-acetyltransferase/predicted enzyme related to lactoylglutathione lyase
MEKNHLPAEIRSERVTLRKYERSMAELMFSFVDQDRQRLRQFLPWVDHMRTAEDEISFIKMASQEWDAFETFGYGIFRNKDKQYMGNIGLHAIEWEHDRCEIGYWILGKYEGHGYVSESVTTLERVCFDRGFHRIEIRCSSKNLRSAGVPIRCGYRLEGSLTQDAIELGSYRDTLIFGKVKGTEPLMKLPMIALDFVYLFTSDIEASKNWYQKVLGIQPRFTEENYVEFRPGGHCGLCLHPADEKSPLTTGGAVGYWRVINFAEVVAHFEKHGAKVYRGPLDIGNGERICQILDPIGNVIGLVG